MIQNAFLQLESIHRVRRIITQRRDRFRFVKNSRVQYAIKTGHYISCSIRYVTFNRDMAERA